MAKQISVDPVTSRKERVHNTRKVLELIEQGGIELLERVAAAERQGPTSADVYMIAKMGIAEAINLAWASRNFPIFDVKALERLREFDLKNLRIESEGINVDVKLFLPYFAWGTLGGGGTDQYSLSGELGIFRFRGDHIAFDNALSTKNRERLSRAVAEKRREPYDGMFRSTYFRIWAKAPSVPADVQRRVAEVAHRFEDVSLIWEAEWEPMPEGDPLVVGTIKGVHFLIDQYDVTKLERYIVSEFTTKRG